MKLDVNGVTDRVFDNRHPKRYHEVIPASVIKNAEGNHFISFEKAASGVLKLTLD